MTSFELTRVLVIDDEPAIRRALRRGLESLRFVVYELPTGRGAEDVVLNQNIDIVVTDLAMPERAGVETLTALRRLHPELPIVVLTGSGFQEISRQLGASCTLTKPIENDALAKVIADHVRAARDEASERRRLLGATQTH